LKASNARSSKTGTPGAPPRNAEYCSSTDRFTLAGPSADLDPRYNAYRGDLADVALASRLFAPHYAKPVTRRNGAHAAPLRVAPADDSEFVGELAPHEDFALLDTSGGWAWGYRMSDHLVGYVREKSVA
jgi:hypothetical protein